MTEADVEEQPDPEDTVQVAVATVPGATPVTNVVFEEGVCAVPPTTVHIPVPTTGAVAFTTNTPDPHCFCGVVVINAAEGGALFVTVVVILVVQLPFVTVQVKV